MKQLHIGIDFDNTIVCYDHVFYKAALEQDLIPHTLSPLKTHIRDHFRSIGKEDTWTQLQGYIYGARMDLAQPYQGIGSFFNQCKENGIKISIISHKTKKPYLGPSYDLHESAYQWLLKQAFFNDQIDVFFELTLQKKLERIAKVKCDFFIDDLPELLNEPTFPQTTKRILFDPANLYPENSEWTAITSWDLMSSILK